MFRTFITIFFLCSHLSFSYARTKVTVYGDATYPPYSFGVNQFPKGIYVDILKKAFSRMEKYEVTIEVLPWKRGIKYIQNGKAFALFPPYFGEHRTAWMIYSEPILKEKVIVFGKAKKLKTRKEWPRDFYNTTIGLNRGFGLITMAGKAFEKAVKSGKIKIMEADTNDLSLKRVERDRIDFYINDQMIDITPYKGIVRGMTIKVNYGYLGFTKKIEAYPYFQDFKDSFDEIIKEMKNSGEIKSIVDSYRVNYSKK